MASTKGYMVASKYRFLTKETIFQSPPHSTTTPTKPELEFDESDIWGVPTLPGSPDSRQKWRQTRRPMSAAVPPKCVGGRGDASSLPVNIPDWSKILRQEYRSSYGRGGGGGGSDGGGGGDDGDGGDERVPPHEYLARTRMASFSVHEGIGRTLKGRDLSKKFVQILGEIKELLSVVVKHIGRTNNTDGEKVHHVTTPVDSTSKIFANELKDDKVDQTNANTPADSIVTNRSNSPFINSDGGLMTFSQKALTKRKLDLDGEDTENIDVTCEFKSFSARNVRFSKLQFPPGLETLKDVKEDPKNLKVSKSRSNSNTVDDEPHKKSADNRTPRTTEVNVGKVDENQKTPSSKPASKSSSKSSGNKKARSIPNVDEESKPASKSSSKSSGNKKTRSIPNVDEEGTQRTKSLVDIDEMFGSVKTAKKCKKRVCKAKPHIGDGLPKPIFKDFLPHISYHDKTICLYIASNKDDSSHRLYSPTNSLFIMDIGESWCVFPDAWLSDHFITVSLYDYHLNLLENGCATKMVLPAQFQGLVFKSDERSLYFNSECIAKWCARLTCAFFPHDLKKVEEVYMPILDDQDSPHWFLLVLHVAEKRVFIVDSLGVSRHRRKLSESMMTFAGNELRRNRIGFMFKNFADFKYEEVEVPHQPNCHDCGMYVLKYIECGDIAGMKKIRYSTDEMRVERLRHLARLVSSKHNNEYMERLKTMIEQ